MDKQEVSDLCGLNCEQKKAFNSLRRAYKKCLDKNIYFYQVLESLHAYNGNNVEKINDTDVLNQDGNSVFCTQWIYAPSLKITDAWADDNHFVHLKTGSKE